MKPGVKITSESEQRREQSANLRDRVVSDYVGFAPLCVFYGVRRMGPLLQSKHTRD